MHQAWNCEGTNAQKHVRLRRLLLPPPPALPSCLLLLLLKLLRYGHLSVRTKAQPRPRKWRWPPNATRQAATMRLHMEAQAERED